GSQLERLCTRNLFAHVSNSHTSQERIDIFLLSHGIGSDSRNGRAVAVIVSRGLLGQRLLKSRLFSRELREVRQRPFQLHDELDHGSDDLAAEILIALRHQHLIEVGPHDGAIALRTREETLDPREDVLDSAAAISQTYLADRPEESGSILAH